MSLLPFVRAAVAGAVLGVSALGVGLPWPHQTASAGDAAAQIGAKKIRLAGRQRMLVGRIAKAACFVTIGVSKPRHVAQLTNAVVEFDKTTQALVEGSAVHGIGRETDPTVLAALRDVQGSWAYVRPLALGVRDHGDVSALKRILQARRTFTDRTNSLITALEVRHTDGGSTPLLLAASINVAERQAFLSQKLALEVCLIAAGHTESRPRAHLLGTAALFESSQAQLSATLVGLPLPTHVATFMQTLADSIKHSWQIIKPELGGLPGPGATLSKPFLKSIAVESETLLDKLVVAVSAYESAVAPTIEARGGTGAVAR